MQRADLDHKHCKTCSPIWPINNVSQVCVSVLKSGLPVEVGDTALAINSTDAAIPKSDVNNRDFFADEDDHDQRAKRACIQYESSSEQNIKNGYRYHGNMAVALTNSYPSVISWPSLPLPVVFLILDKLLEPIDHVRFAAVCKEWCCLSKGYNHATLSWRGKALPMLVIHTIDNKSRLTRQRLYSVWEGKICNNIQFQVPYSRRCCGSSHGWLATVDQTDQGLIIALHNPFRKLCPIRIPPLVVNKVDTLNYEFRVPKVILSTDPVLNPKNYVVIALYKAFELAFIKAGQNCWTCIKQPCDFTDVIFYTSQIYVVQRNGAIYSLDVNCSNNLSKPLKPKLRTPEKCTLSGAGVPVWTYLVESAKGNLYRIQRFYGYIRFKLWNRKWMSRLCTESFKVYKLVFNDKDGSIVEEVEVKSIGDEALFVGSNHSVSVLGGCQPNSIYYTDDQFGTLNAHNLFPYDDMGIFNLEDGTIAKHYTMPLEGYHEDYIPAAFWVVPTFYGL